MVNHKIYFIIKVLEFSTVFLIIIKYERELVTLTLTTFNVIIEIIILFLLTVFFLTWRLRNLPSISFYIKKDLIR